MGLAVPKPSYGRLTPKQSKRNEFNKLTRDIIYERDEGACRICGGPAQEIHHVRFRSQGGRGVPTNGICVCHHCHGTIHNNPEIAHTWQRAFEDQYGPEYYKDRFDD